MSRPGRRLVTAVIPVHNGMDFVGDAINGVLEQTYAPIECVVVDDGSTDATADRVRSFGSKVQLIQQPNRGVAAARNTGAAAAAGAFVAFCDADDVWLAEKTERQMTMFDRDPDLALVYCGVRTTDADLCPLEDIAAPAAADGLRNTLVLEPPIISAAQTVLLRTSAFDSVGGFNEDLSTSADVEFACRVAMRHRVDGLIDPLVLYRQHRSQMHRDIAVTERDMQRVFDVLFADPHLPVELRDLRRRGEANLYVTLALMHLHQSEVMRFLAAGAMAMRRSPRRVLSRIWTLVRHAAVLRSPTAR